MSISSSQKLSLFIGIAGLIACVLSVMIASLYAVTIDLFNIAIISFFFSILIKFIISETSNVVFTESYFFSIIFLFTYILLIIWLGLSKVIPEYNTVTTYEKQRYQLINKLMMENKEQEDIWKLKLAKHYLSAPDLILRDDLFVRYKGIKMMEKLLNEKIEQGLEQKYKHDMFYLAEFAYHFSPDKISKRWYKNAYDAGRLDALERHAQRFEENFKDSEANRFNELEKYNQEMRLKYND